MRRRVRSSSSLLIVIAALSSVGCSIGQKRTVLETAFDERERRQEYFEATLRVLDEKPEYVDEFFQAASKHPKTLDRFIANTARELRDEKLAVMTAKHLAANPESLKQVLVQTLEAAKLDAGARAAFLASIQKTSPVVAEYLSKNPNTLKTMTKALLKVTAKNSKAKLREVLDELDGDGSDR